MSVYIISIITTLYNSGIIIDLCDNKYKSKNKVKRVYFAVIPKTT